MFGLGATELIIIAVIFLILFGAKRLPEIGKGIGGAVREFKNIKKEIKSDPVTKTEDADEEEKSPGLLEEKIKKQVIDHVPVAKKAVEFTDKVKKVNEILK
ncbi:MAG: twin-arginine translocase TatA/TatE family subunit [Deltaproteobacteria bacterium]|nr:twin-arginine translocase TatA/TatE family subunit [Deltaproteobacteria bacterium]